MANPSARRKAPPARPPARRRVGAPATRGPPQRLPRRRSARASRLPATIPALPSLPTTFATPLDARTMPSPHPLRRREPGSPPRTASRGAFSDSTERARRADLAMFRAWCAARGAAELPTEPGTLAAFVDEMAAARAPATVRRYVASIAAAHRASDLTCPTGSAVVGLALRRMDRHRGRRQKQARGLTWALRERLLAATGDRLIDARNRALVAVAYDAMLRRSELAAACVADLARAAGGTATLLVPRSKTDPAGRSATVYIASDTTSLLDEWLRRSAITDGRLFRSLRKDGAVGERLHPSQVPRIIKAMARRAGLQKALVAGLSGHSPRVGAAQDMIAAGIELPAILQAGRWKTAAMVSRYGERLLARRSAAAQLARLQGRE